jgi:hypothetical protein
MATLLVSALLLNDFDSENMIVFDHIRNEGEN